MKKTTKVVSPNQSGVLTLHLIIANRLLAIDLTRFLSGNKIILNITINVNTFLKYFHIKKTTSIKIAFLSSAWRLHGFGPFYRPRQKNNISNNITFLCKESISNKTSNVNENSKDLIKPSIYLVINMLLTIIIPLYHNIEYLLKYPPVFSKHLFGQMMREYIKLKVIFHMIINTMFMKLLELA